MAIPNWLTNQKPSQSIRGLSEIRRLPRLGKVRLGIKKVSASGAEYPSEVPYFVCPPEVQASKYPDGTPYGDKPTKLRIMFPVSNREAVFPQALKRYGRSQGLLCRGDGNVAFEAQADGTLKQVPCPCEHLEPTLNAKGEEQAAACGPMANLMVFLPDVSMAGCYQIDTGSIANITRVNSYLDYVIALVGGYTGKFNFSFVPLWLHRVKEEMQSVKRKAKSTHYLLRMEIDADYIKEIAKGRPLLPPPPETTLEIEAPDTIQPATEDVAVPPPVEDGPDGAPGAVTEHEETKPPEPTGATLDPEKEAIVLRDELEGLVNQLPGLKWETTRAVFNKQPTIETKRAYVEIFRGKVVARKERAK